MTEIRFKQNLNLLLAERGVSQSDLADALNMPRQTVNNWIMGNTHPSAHRAQLVADYFKVSVSDLLYGDLSNNKPKTSQGDIPQTAPDIMVTLEKNIPGDYLRRLLFYALKMKEADLEFLAKMAEKLADKETR